MAPEKISDGGPADEHGAHLKALVEALGVAGVVSAWPDQGWPEDEEDDADLDDEEWIVGCADRNFLSGEYYAVEVGDSPAYYDHLMTLRSRKAAEAMVLLLNAARAGSAAS